MAFAESTDRRPESENEAHAEIQKCADVVHLNVHGVEHAGSKFQPFQALDGPDGEAIVEEQ